MSDEINIPDLFLAALSFERNTNPSAKLEIQVLWIKKNTGGCLVVFLYYMLSINGITNPKELTTTIKQLQMGSMNS